MNLRESTVAKSKELCETLRKRETESLRRKSNKLIRLADREKASLDEQIELAVVDKSGNNTDSDTSAKDTNSNSEENISNPSGSQEEYWYDTSNTELTGFLESPATPSSVVDQDPDTWSSVNRFFPEGCVRSPPIFTGIRKAASYPILGPSPILHSSNITISEEDNQLDLASTSSGSPPSPTLTVIMAMDLFNAKFLALKKQKANLYLLIDCYNKDTVTILDKDEYKGELKNIQDSLIKFQDKTVDLQDSLNMDIEEQRIMYNDITASFEEAKVKVVQNATSVKRQIVKLMEESTSSRLNSSAEADRKKLVLKVTNATARFKSLKDEVSKLSEVDLMSEHEIRESLLSSKDWKKDLKSFETLKETLDIDMVSTAIDEDLNTQFQKEYKETVELVTEKVSKLILADKNLGLYSLTENKSKSTVQYPDPFGGTLGENVFKFIKEFKEALAADQVRKADEVKTLIKYIKGDAKMTIGEHHISLNSAIKQLEDNYGCPRLIVEKYTKDYDKALGNIRSWGKHGTKERVDAINKTVDFIRNLQNLATDHPGHLKGEIYSKQTLLLLTKGMPHEYTKKLNENCSHTDPYEDWITSVFDILEECKSTNLSALSTGIGASKSSKEDHTGSSKVHQMSHNGHDCAKSNNCKDRWDFLGCINLYKVTQLSDRESFLRERRACFKCGRSPFSIKGGKRHICSWKNGKMAARCTGKHTSGGRCYKAAAMCLEHSENASDILLDWLQSHRIKFSVNMILLNHGSELKDRFYEDMKNKVSKQDSSVAKARPIAKSRESLQSGESSIMMTDDEIHDFFSHDMRKISSNAKVQRIPEGDPVFIFCAIQGLNGPVMCFIDGGCNCWLAQEGIPEKEFISVKLTDGPIPLSVASGMTAYATAEYASLLPLANGNYQTVRGLTMPKVTGDMPQLNLVPAFDQIKAECPSNRRVQNLKVPSVVGGQIQMILGIKYQSIYPEIIHTFPNGLTIFESKLRPAEPGALACIGGPISSLEYLCGSHGALSTLSYMANLTRDLGSYLKLDLFPSCFLSDTTVEDNIPGALCSSCGVFLVQSELEKFMRLQDSGLDTSFKCPACRNCKNCLKGPGKELLSMKEEFHQQAIEDSVRLDDSLNQAVARLAFISDPSESLEDNEHIAVRRLKDVCRKYGGSPEVRAMISKGFQKLVDRNHSLLYDELSNEDKMLADAKPNYVIPWDIGFKEDSLSTPARPTFDASSKTPGGSSLNDHLAKGRTDLVNLFNMVMGWIIGPVAIHGDISQFYNAVLLDRQDWKFQRVVWYKDLDPSGPLMKGIVRTLIYGVRCVSAQTEYVKRLLQENIRSNAVSQKQIDVADFIRDKFYVDDGGNSVFTLEDAHELTSLTDSELARINMKVKGWSISFNQPSPEVSEDGISVGFAGMMWIPEVDSFSLKIQPLHFGKKKRGKYPDNLERYVSGSLEQFVPEVLTRRMCTSVAARIYDVPGLLAPLTLKLKFDLRKLILVDPSWDASIPDNLRQLWIQNFKFIEEMRDILYVRCRIPEDAVRCTVRLWLLCDGSPDGGMIVTAYSGCERKDGSWSCQLLCAKNLLTPQGWTTPQTELHALSSLSNLAAVLQSALQSWVEILYSGSDSSIAISWAVYEKVRLHVFHRLRVSNIRNKIDLGQLFHVNGKDNVADIGTRPELLKPEQLMPGSEWLCGKTWMTEPISSAVSSGVIKGVNDIKLDNDAKKLLKEGIMLDSSLNTVSSLNRATLSSKVIEREHFSNYIFPPLKWGFPRFVRITSWVLLAVRKFKLNMVRARERKGLPVSDGSSSESLRLPQPKFSVFNVFSVPSYDDRALSKVFSVNGVKVLTKFGVKSATLSDSALSVGLEYIYRKAGSEVLQFNDRKYIDKIGEVVDGIVYCKSRIQESQELRAVGGLENIVDLETFTGVRFKVPIVDRFSPIAISLAHYLHYYVIKHRGIETTHRMSLKYVRILGSRSLAKLVHDDCIYCKKLFLKYIKQVMGPLSDQQLSVSPIFFYCYADAWGPLRAYVPSHQRSTRSGDKTYDIHMLVFGCAATGMINCQIMEGGKATSNVLDAMNRFFVEACVPKIMFVDKDSALI